MKMTKETTLTKSFLANLLNNSKGSEAIWLANCIVDPQGYRGYRPVHYNIIEAATITGRSRVIEGVVAEYASKKGVDSATKIRARNAVVSARRRAMKAEDFLKEIGDADHLDSQWIFKQITKKERASLIIDACLFGKAKVVKSCIDFIDRDPNRNRFNSYLYRFIDNTVGTPHLLALAAYSDDVATVRILVNRNFDINKRYYTYFPNRSTTAFIELKPNQLQMQKAMLELKVDPSLRTTQNFTAFHANILRNAYAMAGNLIANMEPKLQGVAIDEALKILRRLPSGSQRNHSLFRLYMPRHCDLLETMRVVLLSRENTVPCLNHQLLGAAEMDQVDFFCSCL